MTDGFIFYASFMKALATLPDADRLKAYDAICRYALYDEEPTCEGAALGMFYMAQPQIDANRKRRENGTKGGRPKTRTEPTENQTETKQKPKENQTETKVEAKEKDKVKVKDKVKDINTMSGKPDGAPLLMPTVKEVVDYLNTKAGTHYRANVRQTVDKVKARLNDGFTVEDFKTVIDIKTAEWMGTEWQKFIRPETLFGAKFESYLNQRPAQKKNAAGKFANFEQRNDPEHSAMVAQLIAMQ